MIIMMTTMRPIQTINLTATTGIITHSVVAATATAISIVAVLI